MYQKFAKYFSRKQRAVMPAQAGIQGQGGADRAVMDSRLRGNDKNKVAEFFIVLLIHPTTVLSQKYVAQFNGPRPRWRLAEPPQP